MKVAVAFHSRWGNCRRIAQSIVRGLSDAGQDVRLFDIKAGEEPDEEFDMLVLGSGTRAGRSTGPVRRFMKRGMGPVWSGKSFAAFSTGLKDRGEKTEPKGADDIYSQLESAGLKPLAPAFKAIVEGMKGPLAEGEAERAVQFGRDLARALEQGG